MAEASTANATDMDVEQTQPVEPKARKGKGLMIALLVLVLLAGGGGYAAWTFLLKPEAAPAAEEGATASKGKPLYLEITPNFVVNLEDPDLMRYLQLELQVMTHDADALKQVEAYMPEIRNNLLLMFAQQNYASLLTRDGKEALQKSALNEINSVLQSHGDKTAIEAVLFTSFVMQ